MFFREIREIKNVESFNEDKKEDKRIKPIISEAQRIADEAWANAMCSSNDTITEAERIADEAWARMMSC